MSGDLEDREAAEAWWEGVVAAMRDWAADCTWPDVTSEELLDEDITPADWVANGIEVHYDGGIRAFVDDYQRDWGAYATPVDGGVAEAG